MRAIASLKKKITHTDAGVIYETTHHACGTSRRVCAWRASISACLQGREQPLPDIHVHVSEARSRLSRPPRPARHPACGGGDQWPRPCPRPASWPACQRRSVRPFWRAVRRRARPPWNMIGRGFWARPTQLPPPGALESVAHPGGARLGQNARRRRAGARLGADARAAHCPGGGNRGRCPRCAGGRGKRHPGLCAALEHAHVSAHPTAAHLAQRHHRHHV